MTLVTVKKVHWIERIFGHPYRNLPLVKNPRPGRNQPCPCGSGKKFKDCCINKKQYR